MSSNDWMGPQQMPGSELTPDLQIDRLGVPELEQKSTLDRGICLQAIYSRDSRFDGRFFAGTTSTGLYCRNICPAPYTNPDNIRLFCSVLSAESAGFRPCKRCHPQAVPGVGAWLGTSAVVSRATRMILEGALNGRISSEIGAWFTPTAPSLRAAPWCVPAQDRYGSPG